MSQRTLIVIVLGALAAVGIWFFYFRQAPSETDQETITYSPEVQQIERDIADLRRLKELQIDTSILQNPFLQALTTLPPPSVGTSSAQQVTPGRPNPFVPF